MVFYENFQARAAKNLTIVVKGCKINKAEFYQGISGGEVYEKNGVYCAAARICDDGGFMLGEILG